MLEVHLALSPIYAGFGLELGWVCYRFRVDGKPHPPARHTKFGVCYCSRMNRTDWLARAQQNAACGVAVMSRAGFHVPNQPFEPLSAALTDVLVLLTLSRDEGLLLTRAEDELVRSRGAITRAVLDLRNKLPGSERFETIVTHTGPTAYEFATDLFDLDLDQFEIELAQARHAFQKQDYAAAADRALDATSYAAEVLNPLAATGGLPGGIIDAEKVRLAWGVQWAWWLFAQSCLRLGLYRPVELHLRSIVTQAESEILWGCYIFARYARSGSDRQEVLDTSAREFRANMGLHPRASVTEDLIAKLREADGEPEQSLLDAYIGMAHIDPAEEFSWRIEVDGVTAISSDEIRGLLETRKGDSGDPSSKLCPDESIEILDSQVSRTRPRWFARAAVILAAVLVLTAALSGRVARDDSAEGFQAFFVFDDLDGQDLEVFAEPVTADAILTTVGAATVESDDAGNGGVLVLRPNPTGEIGRSHHVSVAFRPLVDLPPGPYLLSIRCRTPETIVTQRGNGVPNRLETGPELSVQVTKGGATAVVGFQAVPNPWVNALNIWSTQGWFELAVPHHPSSGEWIDVALAFDTATDQYVSLLLEAKSWAEPMEIDLSGIPIPYEAKTDAQGQPFLDGVVLSVEAQNQFTNPEQPESTRGEIACDDLRLSST